MQIKWLIGNKKLLYLAKIDCIILDSLSRGTSLFSMKAICEGQAVYAFQVQAVCLQYVFLNKGLKKEGFCMNLKRILSATRYMKVKRMEITEILGRIWLFSANKIKSSESVSKQPTHLNSSSNSTHHCGRN